MSELSSELHIEQEMSLFIVCKPDHTEQSIKDILSSGNFVTHIDSYITTHENKIVYLSIFPLKNKERNFEVKKKDFIESINNICEYISIIYDQETVEYMKQIAQSVYVLEREFRTLIEIIFLKQHGSGWYEKLFKDHKKENDRIKDRDKVLEYLKNPLDNLNFIDLTQFVEERIKLSKNNVLDKLDLITGKLESFEIAGGKKTDLYKSVIENLEDIKKIQELKNNLEASNFYRHITPEVAKQWRELYSYRNPWAHNHCLLTKEEIVDYSNLASSVLKKVRTEMTLISLLAHEEELSFNIGKVSFTITNFSKFGSSFCVLKLQLSCMQIHYILEITEATYIDFFDILKIIAKFLENKAFAKKVSLLEQNPFLTEIITSSTNEILTELNNVNDIDKRIDDLESMLLEENSDYKFKKLEGNEFVLKEDVDRLLGNIKPHIK